MKFRTLKRSKTTRLSLSEKLGRLAVRMKDREWRRYAGLLMGGKALGVSLLMLAIFVISGVFFGHVYAADTELKAADVVNPVNTACWRR